MFCKRLKFPRKASIHPPDMECLMGRSGTLERDLCIVNTKGRGASDVRYCCLLFFLRKMTGSAWQLSDAGAYSPIRFYRNSLNRGLFCIPEIFVKHKFSVNSKGRTERRDNETDTISCLLYTSKNLEECSVIQKPLLTYDSKLMSKATEEYHNLTEYLLAPNKEAFLKGIRVYRSN